MFIKSTNHSVFSPSNSLTNHAILFGVSLPLTYVGVKSLFLLGVPHHQLLRSVCIATATATILDGVAFAWFPNLYGSDGSVRKVASWALWAVGWGLVWGQF